MGRGSRSLGPVCVELPVEWKVEVEVEAMFEEEVKVGSVEGGVRRMTSEFEMPTVRRRNEPSGVQRTASSEGRPLIVKLGPASACTRLE